ncbi:MAG: hypothetical protein A2078_15835 [Nitrospirae bacterium GWC2_57_9]|nr:MAG: hypothetical protein A2078_15835 [Nitrospirae bacterium GWC2_57_9]
MSSATSEWNNATGQRGPSSTVQIVAEINTKVFFIFLTLIAERFILLTKKQLGTKLVSLLLFGHDQN